MTVLQADVPVAGATVTAGSQSTSTDASGIATLTLLPGPASVLASKDGYDSAEARVEVVAGKERAVRLTLRETTKHQDQPTRVASTRTGRPIDEQAVPVEVLGRGQIEDNLLIAPGNIVRTLDAMAGLRVQTTSPELGLATVRMQGLRGQYTRLLSEGVPLYFDLPGGVAPVQIPPMDLDRIEVITGGASALFGANALGGVVNLLARRPGPEGNRQFLVSQSTRNGTDGVLWLSPPQTGSWGHTLLVGGHRQEETDVDDDGWSDIPGYDRGMARTRLVWDNGRGRSISGTAGVTFEKRKGGSDFAHQELETKIADGALFGQMPLGRFVLAGAGSLYVQSRVRDFSDRREQDRRQGATIEIRLHGTAPRHSWVAGIAADWFAIRARDGLASGYVAPRGGVFVHDDLQLAPWLVVSGSARLDYNKGAGDALRVNDFLFSPRGSALVRGGQWSARVSGGRSYFIPSPLTEETEAAGFRPLFIAGPLEIETATSVSADVTHHTRASTVTLTVFRSQIDDPALVDRATYTLRTETEPVVTNGAQFQATVRRPPFAVTGTYAFVRARELDRQDVALTPRHSAGFSASAGTERRGRVVAQVNFTGVQRLDANPFRFTSEPYTVVNLLGEFPVGRWRWFVSGDNLTDVRQTRWDPIARPLRGADGRWTVDAWAPLDGRTFNGGVRIALGEH